MRCVRRLMAAFAVALLCWAGLASHAAAEDRTERVRFANGRTAKTIRDSVQGYDGVNYLVGVREGQRLAVTISTDNDSSYFNIWAPAGSEAVFIGSTSGDSADIITQMPGDYRIQVYLMRNAARRNERANFALSIEVTGGKPAAGGTPEADFADSLSGGPDLWEVANVPANDRLNVRSRPSAQAPVVARLRNGTVLRNRGCRMAGSTRWCRVERQDGSASGWAAGRYLVEFGG